MSNTAPPLTLDWLKVHQACLGGQRRFTNMAPQGSLPMDEMAAHKLFSYHTFSDIGWLLRKIIGMDNAYAVSCVTRDACSRDEYSETKRREYKWRMANACVAAWQEYHK